MPNPKRGESESNEGDPLNIKFEVTRTAPLFFATFQIISKTLHILLFPDPQQG